MTGLKLWSTDVGSNRSINCVLSLPTYLINSGLIENAGTNNKKHCFQSTDTYYQ